VALRIVPLMIALWLLAGAGQAGGEESRWFPVDRVLEIELRLPPADWERLRREARDLGHGYPTTCLSEPPGQPYTWFEAGVKVDGRAYPRSRARKKGMWGSLDEARPSLKLRLGQPGDARPGTGRRLTLNNLVEDPSLVRTCLAYGLFRRAGLPAPRCALAHLRVNGADLGVYAHVERYGRSFLARAFGPGELALWEGVESDFRAEQLPTFARERGPAEADGALVALAAALPLPDAQALPALERLLDLEAFLSFWALEVLTAHEDGYSYVANNFFVVRGPGDGRLRFLPWGIEGSLSNTGDPAASYPILMATRGALALRLYSLPATRERFAERVRTLAEELLDGDALAAEAERLQRLAWAHAPPAQRAAMVAADAVLLDFLCRRREVLRSVLELGPPTEGLELPAPPCVPGTPLGQPAPAPE